LAFYFLQFAEIGREFHGNAADLFIAVREKGKIAEDAMFKATSGINTHRRLFSFGIHLCSSRISKHHQYTSTV
jgi:triphosphoribosyl-dephospho-CoA synthase